MLSKIFLFYLVDTPTGAIYYLDENGSLQTTSIHNSDIDPTIESPGDWMSTELSFKRNMVYYGTNRSFSLPLKFVIGAAKIIRQLYYTGKGVNIPLTLIVLKYNELPKAGEPLYKLYYRGQMDLKQIRDLVAEAVQCNLMEGGVTQLLKTYENTVFQIPCDGSIPENVKVDLDGLLLPDTFHYQIQFNQDKVSEQVIPCFFQSNDGDNFGIIHNDPQAEPGIALNTTSSLNYIFQSLTAITVRVKGNITIRPYNSQHGDYPFHLYLIGSNYPTSARKQICPDLDVRQQQVVYFDETFDLTAGEKLYFAYTHNNKFNPMAIVGGNFDISFNSMEQATSPWCVSALDLFKLLLKEICLSASATDQTFNYEAVSNLLEQNLNILISSGDAIRASGDANYQKFFQAFELNTLQPSANYMITYGPVIKTSLSDFFKSLGAVLCASLGNQNNAQFEQLFFEDLLYVFNPDATPVVLGEVSNLQVSLASDMLFNELEVGYEPQSYDQKAGKYETNTKASWVSPLRAVQKKFQIISKYRADPYGIERLRANIGGTSSTRNDSDNSVFMINANRTIQSLDAEKATFNSNIKDPYDGNHTNIDYQPNYKANGIGMTNVQGNYLSMNNDPAIFVFAQATTQPFQFTFSGTLIGSPANALTGSVADFITISLFVKGVKVYTRIFTSTSAATDFSDTFSISSQAWAVGDCIYTSVETSLSGSTSNMQAQYSCGVAGGYWTAIGSSIEVLEGVAARLIALPNVTPAPIVGVLPVVSYGFQYFLFNSILVNSTFDIAAAITAVLQPGSAQSVVFNLFYNGLVASSQTLNNDPLNTTPQTANLSTQQTFVLGDVVFLTVDVTDLWAQVQSAEINFTSTTIIKYGLKRIQYSSLSGIPNLLSDTTSPGAPYNIEDFSPKRMLAKWYRYVRSILFNQIPGTLQFLSLSKNQYLSTTTATETITENADVDIHDMDDPLFYPLVFEFDTKVPINFADLLTSIPNTHIEFNYNGVSFYGFPLEVKQKPALNESQQWRLLCSPKTDIQNLINLDIDGLNSNTMPPNSLSCAFLSGVQFVPENTVIDPRYHTRDMNSFWYCEQISRWLNQNNYYNPWQIGETINLQFRSNGLSPVTAYLYSATTKQIVDTVVLTQKSSNAIVGTITLWEGTISLIGKPVDTYYLRTNAGGDAGAYMIGEGLDVRADWPDTLLFEYSNSVNKQSMVFDTGFSTSLRVKGFIDNRMKPKFKAAFYIDQPQDITVLNGIPYETRELWIGMDDGVPDYIMKKLVRILLLDDTKIDGVNYSLDEGAEWEETFIEGNPKKYWKINIRPSQNIDGISVTATGISSDTTMFATADANAFGPNANNATNIPDADIISIKIN